MSLIAFFIYVFVGYGLPLLAISFLAIIAADGLAFLFKKLMKLRSSR